MELEIQIQSIVFSIAFGMFFSLIFNLSYKYIIQSKGLYKCLANFVFILDFVIIYFLIIKLINNAIIHFYFLLAILFGFFIGNRKTKLIRKKLKS